MKESFGELYTRLYRENINELEALRGKAKKEFWSGLVIIVAIFLSICINPAFLFLILTYIIFYLIRINIKSKNTFEIQKRPKTYKEVFKEKIIKPLIMNMFEASKYEPLEGISRIDYRKAGYNEPFDRYSSEDLVIAPLRIDGEISSFITFAEVLTERESRDSEGRTTYTTVFNGLAGSFLIPKNLERKIYIRANGRVSSLNKNKVKMDMTEFEKKFDVESDDPILAMRILTSDVMTEMLDLYERYKYRFEINIINDTVYMRLSTGALFEPSVFSSSMEYKQIEKYYLVLKALITIAEHIYQTVYRLDV